jgi:hypothetical protein
MLGPTPSPSEIVVTREQFGTTVNVEVEDTISIPRPSDFENWQIDYASPPLELLTPPEKRSTPGPNGWRFRAIATGESDIGLSPITTGDAQPPRFVITIRITR